MHDAHSNSKKKAKRGSGSGSAAQSGKGGDQSTEQLKAMGKKLGNDELQQRIQRGNATRDELMDFLHDRLKNIRSVQEREIAMSDKRSSREHWRQISDQQKTEYTNPDPTRWRESAKIYEQAAFQLSRGSLGRGAQLVKRALGEEQKTFDKLSVVVKVTQEEREGLESGPEGVEDVAPNEGCSAKNMPSEVRELAQQIQNVTEKAPELPGRKRVRDPWWTEEEEEEEEEANGGTG